MNLMLLWNLSGFDKSNPEARCQGVASAECLFVA